MTTDLKRKNVSNVYQIHSSTQSAGGDTTNAAQELLQNGILVETNKGLICMSLKDALHQGVGGLNLSEEDFKNVAAELLFQEEPGKMIVPAAVADDDSVLQISDLDSVLHLKPTPRSALSQRTVLKRKYQLNDGGLLNDLAVAGPSTSKGLIKRRLIHDGTDSEELDSVLVSDSGLSSDTSEVVSLSNTSTESSPVKKRGGWPKGRKRKPETKSEIRQPKAPATGYVIFLNEKRKDYKDMPFTEVTKLLGNEWSRLSLLEKRRYLDQAEVDKKRYREELKTYRQSDAYRQYLQRKRLKRLQGNGTEESDMDATDEIDEEDSEELYCRSCDQWFHSLHNKKEHLYGRQHLASISGRGKSEEWPASTSLDESSLDGCRDDLKEKRSLGLQSMDDAMIRFMAANAERENEIRALKEKLGESKLRNRSLLASLTEANKSLKATTSLLQEERDTHSQLEALVFNLFSVPTLFCL